MPKNRFARYKFEVRRDVLYAFGQKRTMKGQNFNKHMVQLPLIDRSSATLRAVMKQAVAELDEALDPTQW